MKRNFKSIVFLIVLLVTLHSCTKCYKCYPLHAYFRCTQNVDTVYFFFGHIKGASDSIQKYQLLGYTCDTTFWGYGNYTNYCSKDGLARAEDLGDSCVSNN